MIKCRIAELIVELPEVGDMRSRCADYLTDSDAQADIRVTPEEFADFALYGNDTDVAAYMETGALFYMRLLGFGGLMLHASAVAYGGRAYLFSGPSGVGKSTHTQLWKQLFGDDARIINDDKPALRLQEGRWYVHGTPWSGKTRLNRNCKVPLAGICFLKRGSENRIRRLSAAEAVPLLYMQTNFPLRKKENMHRLLTAIEGLLLQIPVFELENLPEPEAAQLSLATMRQAAEEVGL